MAGDEVWRSGAGLPLISEFFREECASKTAYSRVIDSWGWVECKWLKNVKAGGGVRPGF
jgi:hypothetical protein